MDAPTGAVLAPNARRRDVSAGGPTEPRLAPNPALSYQPRFPGRAGTQEFTGHGRS